MTQMLSINNVDVQTQLYRTALDAYRKNEERWCVQIYQPRLLLNIRFDALIRAYIRGDVMIEGVAITRAAIVSEICAIKAALDATNK